jgi:hypothetical protein
MKGDNNVEEKYAVLFISYDRDEFRRLNVDS